MELIEELLLTDEEIDSIWNNPANKTMQIEVPREQFRGLIKQIKNISAQISQAQLAKLQPYIEAERERAVKEYRAKVETILVNYADTVSESNAGSVYYLNGRSVDEYLDLIDRAEIKQGSNQ